MTALTATAFGVLDRLATVLGIEHRFATGSGDADSDVNGWLGYALRDENQSAAMVALRAQLQASLGANVPLKEAELFSYYRALLSASPATIWGANLLEWCRADLGSSGVAFPDQSGNALGYTGTCTRTAADATLNNLATISMNGSTETMTSALSLPLAATKPTTVLAVAKFGAFAAFGPVLDGPSGLKTIALGANTATNVFFANSATLLVNSLYGAWQLFRGEFQGGAGTMSAGTTQRTGVGAGNHAPDPGRKLGATTGQQVQWFELIHLSCTPSSQDMFLYKGYLDALTSGGVLHT